IHMAIPRKKLVDSQNPGFYHCTNRCVRRTFLCGVDQHSGRNYSHRKHWLEKRMKALCELFAIEIYAYAVMNNHYHIVLYLDPKAPLNWTDDEVAERWLELFPGRPDQAINPRLRAMKKMAILHDSERLALYRQRLGDLSWFMRRLNEPLAKNSNREDDCTGKFWEGRYTSQALLDEAALFSCMAYVDLNPVRAKITDKLAESQHTSIKQRLDNIDSVKQLCPWKDEVTPVAGKVRPYPLPMRLQDYIELVEWTGRAIVKPGKADIPVHIAPTLDRLNLRKNHWLKQIENYGNNYFRVVGSIQKIRQKARLWEVRCLHGIAAAKLLYKSLSN
ncbi:transposase, partial [Aliikangiella coralliicola]|uniref:transposase n=1 Tax=Aliikangiella coralliicola TaxID=2592383 RepID=UPI00143D36A7